MSLLEQANKYTEHGLCSLLADLSTRSPIVGKWGPFKSRLPTQSELNLWFSGSYARAMCLVCGKVSGNLVALDFDQQGRALGTFLARLKELNPALVERLVMEHTPSGGVHVYYRCQEPPGKLEVLAKSKPNPTELKILADINTNSPTSDIPAKQVKSETLIELKAEGATIMVSPSPGYQIYQGDLCALPVITLKEHEQMCEIARELSEIPISPKTSATAPAVQGNIRPGDDFNLRGDIISLLEKHGYQIHNELGDYVELTRPGKEFGCSSTIRNGVFHNFSSNDPNFEQDESYSLFSVYTILEHKGDFSASAADLRAKGFGDADRMSDEKVDLSHILCAGAQSPPTESEPELPQPTKVSSDPGVLPVEMLRVPGFVSEVMDFCLQTAPYPNPAMAFCAAFMLLAFLAGRKVKDAGGLRTNFYLIALAYSASGKDWPRKLNRVIARLVGVDLGIRDKFASGEGIEDALVECPNLLYQTDEFDCLIQALNKIPPDPRFEGIMNVLLTMFTTADSSLTVRSKAGRAKPAVIDQPCLSILGTAIPNHWYAAMSGRMLTNGLLARGIYVEGADRGPGQDAQDISSPPPRILEVAKWWSEFTPSIGNLQSQYPEPITIHPDADGAAVLKECRELADGEWQKAKDAKDEVGTTVWGRANEMARKLAMVYALSENHLNPRISKSTATWGREFAFHQARRLLAQVRLHVAESPFHRECLKFQRIFKRHGQEWIPHSTTLREMHMDSQAFGRLVSTMSESGLLISKTVSTGTKSAVHYKLQSP